MIKVGDTVRYLDAVGGGIVTKFQTKDLILVLEPDGFETPILVREVVAVESTNAYNFSKEETKSVKTTHIISNVEELEEEPELTIPPYQFNERDETSEGETLRAYLAFVPCNIKQLQTTDMDLYLINDSNYYLNFQLLSGILDMGIRVQNSIEPHTKLLLETVNKLTLNDFEQLRFQALAYKKRGFDAKPTIDTTLTINPTKFYKLHSFRENDFFEEEALLFSLLVNEDLSFETQINPEALQQAMFQKEQATAIKRPIRKTEKPTIVEVDLHAHELLDNTTGLTNSELLQLQIGKFHEVMRANLKNKGQKIVFIHGKGEGVLRKEIEKELKSKYRSCYFQDASFQEYGFGATQVTIR
ncbi:MAG TPA: DUF2027 domain-containing protein [Paludibacteraceae bacterium]|nr:DUF2027 domain-containing protein [Paludibacteraceae bacterium]